MSTIVERPASPAELPQHDLELVTAGKQDSNLFGPRRIVDEAGGRIRFGEIPIIERQALLAR
jgi:hypothetical protein